MKTNQDLLDQINDLKDQVIKLKQKKKYGLVWENKPEIFEEKTENALPVLIEKGGKFKDIISDKDKDFNILIEGDNYHSLSVLKYTHRQKIDVIYIDPPYNTGNKDFIYNDNIVDKEDTFRHSKWLSFMSKRLKIAKTLLSDDGVIFISIDDNEQAQLKLLCDEVFGDENFVGSLLWKRAKGGGNAKGIVKGHDFILVYTRKNKKTLIKEKSIQKKIIEKDGQTFILNDDFLRKVFGKYDKNLERRCLYEEILEYKDEKKKQEIDDGIASGEYQLIPYKNTKKHIVARLEPLETATSTFYSIIEGCLSETGKADLENLDMADLFDYPKPVELIKKLIKSVMKFNKESFVLDFMAGSGTTGHAVLELNKEDDGNRKFILCTNNENKICENVTYERIKRVSKGHTNKNNEKIKGLGGNLKYLKTDFVKIDSSIDDLKEKIVDASTQILCLKESTFKENYNQGKIKIFENKCKYTAILFDTFYLEDFTKILNKYTDKNISIYVFTYDKDFSKEDLQEISPNLNYSVEPIPEKLLETYQEIFNF
jgi:adenine-specific DNA-methyltransferase